MVSNQQKHSWTTVGIGAAAGAGGSMMLTLILTALAANFVSRQILGEKDMDVLVVGILILSSGCGGLLAAALIGRYRLQACIISGGVYYLLLLACAVLLFGGAFTAVGPTALAILGGSGAAALIGLRQGTRGQKRTSPKLRNWRIAQNIQRGN